MYNFVLPSGQEVELAELTGREEEILTNRKLIKSGEAINRVLLNCTKRIGENSSLTIKDILDLLSGDRLFILVKLRQVSLGDAVDLEFVCPACKETSFISVNLEELLVTNYPEQFYLRKPGGITGKQLLREARVHLPTSGIKEGDQIRLFGRQ
jgi:hypothetical protein